MNARRQRRGLFLWLALLAGATLLPAAAADAVPDRVWGRPVESYPRMLRRWFAALPPQLEYSEVRFQLGDDPRWAQPSFDDRSWQLTGFWDLPARTGIEWLRFRVRMKDGQRMPGGVMITTVVAYEVFWDGVLLGNGGVPGMSREAEIPGRVDSWFSVPAGLLEPGEHVVAIRLSSYRCGFPSPKTGVRFLVDSPAVLQGKIVREALGPTVAAGAMFMVGIVSFIMWLLAARRHALLLLALMCASIVAMQGLHSVRWFFQYPADLHFPALVAMIWLVGLQGVFLVALVIVHFALPGRWWLVAALVPIYVAVSYFAPERLNLEGVYILRVSMVVALACVVWAAWHKRRDAWPAVVGIVVGAIMLVLESEDFRTNFFLKFLPVMLGLMASLALHLHEERRKAQSAQLAAARLELEVLKKNIQPHFLLNTLATIMETIEQEPKTAAALVESLAGEFRILSRVAGERLIPLGQELELCRAHLRVMSLRREVTCTLVAHGVDEHALVPPAIFHTLIENGLTHLLPCDGRQDFELRSERSRSETRYTLLARGRCSLAPPNGDSRSVARSGQENPSFEVPAKEGTGLRYIKARLEESFTGNWTMTGGTVSGGWETVIVLKQPKQAAVSLRRDSANAALVKEKPA